MALIHREAVLGWASWNAVKQQNERADTVEKSAAKEHEASVRYIFRGTFSAAALINRGCFMVHSEAYITHLVFNTMHGEVCSRAGWLMCLSPTEKFKKELADARLIFQQIGSLILTESHQIILTGKRFMLTWVVCNNSWDGGGGSSRYWNAAVMCAASTHELGSVFSMACMRNSGDCTLVSLYLLPACHDRSHSSPCSFWSSRFGNREHSDVSLFKTNPLCLFWIQCFNFKGLRFPLTDSNVMRIEYYIVWEPRYKPDRNFKYNSLVLSTWWTEMKTSSKIY